MEGTGAVAQSELIATLETPSGKGRGDENFPVGSWLIRRELRPHVHAFYRFAREADDIADNPRFRAGREAAPARPHGRSPRRRAAATDAPAARAMRRASHETGVTAQHCHDVLRAFRLDATKLRYRDWDDLMEYCRYSAAPVGRQVLDLHGESARHLAAVRCALRALQVLNHLQDCVEDYRALDRVYLPQRDLAACGARDRGSRPRRARRPALRAVIDRLLDGTDGLIATAARLPPLDRAAPACAARCAVIVELAARLARRLRRGDPLAGRVKLAARRFRRRVAVGLWRGPAMSDAASSDGVAEPRDDAARARRSAPQVEARRHLVLLGDAAAAAGAARGDVRDLCLLPRRRRHRRQRRPAGGEARAARRLARRDRRRSSPARPRLPLGRALLGRGRGAISVCAGRISSPSSTAWRWMRATTFARPTSPTLDLYCDRVASAVGRLSVRIFGDAIAGRRSRRPCAGPRACSSPTSCAISTRMRARGRLYLPRELLRAARHSDDRARRGARAIPRCRAVCARPRRSSPSGISPRRAAAMAQCPRRAMRPAAVMDAVYRATLDRLRRRGWRELDEPVSAADAAEALARRCATACCDDGCSRVHVVGAGLAGLAAAVRLADAGVAVVLHEAAHAGRRPLPLLFRRDARLPHRQRQSPADRRQSRGDGLSRRDRRAPTR